MECKRGAVLTEEGGEHGMVEREPCTCEFRPAQPQRWPGLDGHKLIRVVTSEVALVGRLDQMGQTRSSFSARCMHACTLEVDMPTPRVGSGAYAFEVCVSGCTVGMAVHAVMGLSCVPPHK